MKKLIENLKDPKKKSIIMLVGYGIFFVFVFFILVTGKKVDNISSYEDYLKNRKTEEEKTDNNVINYEYLYKIIDNSKIIEINGTKTDKKEIFSIDGISYCKKDNKIYLSSEVNCEEALQNEEDKPINDKIFDTAIYSYKNIENFLKDRTAKESTTYEDNTSKKLYNINIKEYFDYMNESGKCNNIDCSNINAKISVNGNSKKQIEKVVMDLTEYYKHNYIVEILYTNINNIKEITIN